METERPQDPQREEEGSQDVVTPKASDTSSGTRPDAESSSRSHGIPAEGSKPNRSPTPDFASQLSPRTVDRVFPIRSVVSVDPTQTPSQYLEKRESYFPTAQDARSRSVTSGSEVSGPTTSTAARRQSTEVKSRGQTVQQSERSSRSREVAQTADAGDGETPQPRTAMHMFSDTESAQSGSECGQAGTPSQPHERGRPPSASISSIRSRRSSMEAGTPLMTARFKHVVSEGGHCVITGRDGDVLQRCEDEPIHIPGAVQRFGLLVALHEEADGKLVVRVVSENSKNIIGYSPRQLFGLESFCDILSEEQADSMLDHIDFIREEDSDVETNGPEVFTMSIRPRGKKARKLWCAMHINFSNPDLIICEFELEDDHENPLVPVDNATPDLPEDTLNSRPTTEEFLESTQISSRPLRVLRSARKRKGEAAAMEVFNIMSQVQEQLAAAPTLESFLKVLVGVVKELTGFHRVMIYQFDQAWNGRVVTELVDPRATKDLYKGLNFPAADIPKQARDLYKVNRVRLLYDRDHETARLVCRTAEDLETPLDLTYAYLRAMSPIHIKYLANMAVRSSMSISINAFNELWGLISLHSYGNNGTRVPFPIRKMCRLIGDSASRNIERLSYASRLQARKLINTAPSQHNPTGYIIASSDDLLKLFDADFGLLSIRDETKVLGDIEQSQEALAMLEYFRMRKITSVTTSQDITQDFPDLRYAPGFSVIAGALVVPLSVGGSDFIVFFRRGQMKEVKWAGNPYEKFIKEGTEGYLEPRKSFKMWSETVVSSCREWTEEEVETAAVLCLVYGKFIEVWRQKEAVMQNSQLTRLLLANSAHEVRTPLNAIINYLEIALEGTVDPETRENLAKSHSASKSLIYVINDLLDLTKTEEGVELIKGEVFDLKATFLEATEMFAGDARRKGLHYEVDTCPGLPKQVVGDQRKVRQAISNVCANAIQHTSRGTVRADMYVVEIQDGRVDVEIAVADTGTGMHSKKLDSLFRDLEQVQTDSTGSLDDITSASSKALPDPQEEPRTLGLGLAVVARIVRNMNGQLRLKSEEGKGSRFILQLPFELADDGAQKSVHEARPTTSSGQQGADEASSGKGEVTLVDKDASRPKSAGGTLRREGSPSGSRRSVRSVRSTGSVRSGGSGRSDVDRLIEAIQEPHMAEHRPSGPERATSSGSTRRSRLESSRVGFAPDAGDSQAGSRPTTPRHRRSRSLEPSPHPPSARPGSPAGSVEQKRLSAARRPEGPPPQQLQQPQKPSQPQPGQQHLPHDLTPIKAVKMPDEAGSPPPSGPRSGILGEVDDSRARLEDQAEAAAEEGEDEGPVSAEHMRVLVAEDDPVNSRIMKKRLEKLGHETRFTVNGEECASAFGERSAAFDAVLMDMQMPIVDGLTSTKMIRSFEATHPGRRLHSRRAALNGRVPVIAVSASLVEKEMATYVAAGFDGWILKPVAFARLRELLRGIVDRDVREAALYRPGDWEKGGWFHRGRARSRDRDEADPFVQPATKPDLGKRPDRTGLAEEREKGKSPVVEGAADEDIKGDMMRREEAVARREEAVARREERSSSRPDALGVFIPADEAAGASSRGNPRTA